MKGSAENDLGDLIARARRDGPSPERLGPVRASLEARLVPTDVPRAVRIAWGKVVLGLAAFAVFALGIGLAMRPGAPVPPSRGATPDRAPIASASTAPTEATATPSPSHPTTSEATPEERTVIDEPVPTASSITPPITPQAMPRSAPREHVRAARAPDTSDPTTAIPEEAPTEAVAGSTLREEIALLERAIRLRESGDPARALAVLEEHRERFPSGRLRPERERLASEITQAAEAERDP